MSMNLRIGIMLVAIFLIIVTLIILKKEKIPVKYSLIWLFSGIIILLVAFTPEIFIFVANSIGFKTMSNLIIGMFIVLLLMITMSLTMIVSDQKRKITLLIQEVSILKENINDEK